LRLIGASLVVVDHSWPLLFPGQLTVFPEGWGVSPGYVALMGFFAMSGWQISDSWVRDPSAWRYSARRVLRIMPPLVFVVLATAFVIGPLVTVLSSAEYFSAGRTWSYVVHNAGLYSLQHDLPGVFTDNPYPWSVNGSLWTLPMETTGYLIVLLAGLLGAFGRSRALLFVLLAGLMVADGVFRATIGRPGGGGAVWSLPVGSTIAFLVAFVFGVLLHAYRDRVRLVGWWAWALFALWLVQVVLDSPAERFVLPVMAGYGAIVLAHAWPARLARYDELAYGSYGMYVWAFPLQQLIVLAGVRDPGLLAGLALILSYLAGQLSWQLIEKPTQLLRPKPPRPPRPAAVPPHLPAQRTVAAVRHDSAHGLRHGARTGVGLPRGPVGPQGEGHPRGVRVVPVRHDGEHPAPGHAAHRYTSGRLR
jgi:peptidoglycan/LPS O-acetylase OafA/YrhL